MKAIQIYWTIYFCLLAIYIAYNKIYISKERTMPKDIKIWFTVGCMVYMTIASIIAVLNTPDIVFWWILPIWGTSIILWSLAVNISLGLMLHGYPFYMSEDTWPDKQILVVAQSGELYFLFHMIALLVIGSLTKIYLL